MKNNPTPENWPMWNVAVKQYKRNAILMQKLLEMPIEQFKSVAEIKAKQYYESCLSFLDQFNIFALIKLEKTNHSEYCANETDSGMRFVTAAMFARHHLNIEAIAPLKEMADSIRSDIKHNLKNIRWMNDEARILAGEYLETIRINIGFPDFILNSHSLDQYYERLTIDPKNFSANRLKVSEFNERTKTGDEEKSFMGSSYFSTDENEIFISSSVLNFDSQNSKSLNQFARIGFTIAHELTHAFGFYTSKQTFEQAIIFGKYFIDNCAKGRHCYDLTEFFENYECFNKQFSSYTHDGKHLDGMKTIGKQLLKFEIYLFLILYLIYRRKFG